MYIRERYLSYETYIQEIIYNSTFTFRYRWNRWRATVTSAMTFDPRDFLPLLQLRWRDFFYLMVGHLCEATIYKVWQVSSRGTSVWIRRMLLSLFPPYPIHKTRDIEKEAARTIFLSCLGERQRKRERKRFSLWPRIHLLIQVAVVSHRSRILREHVAHKIVLRPAVSIRRYFRARTRIKTNMNGGRATRHRVV